MLRFEAIQGGLEIAQTNVFRHAPSVFSTDSQRTLNPQAGRASSGPPWAPELRDPARPARPPRRQAPKPSEITHKVLQKLAIIERGAMSRAGSEESGSLTEQQLHIGKDLKSPMGNMSAIV